MSGSMVERVARAMWGADKARWGDDDRDTPRWDAEGTAYVAMARAAIEAMREPTDLMMICGSCEGDDEDGGYISKLDAECIYQRMIDAALKD